MAEPRKPGLVFERSVPAAPVAPTYPSAARSFVDDDPTTPQDFLTFENRLLAVPAVTVVA